MNNDNLNELLSALNGIVRNAPQLATDYLQWELLITLLALVASGLTIVGIIYAVIRMFRLVGKITLGQRLSRDRKRYNWQTGYFDTKDEPQEELTEAQKDAIDAYDNSFWADDGTQIIFFMASAGILFVSSIIFIIEFIDLIKLYYFPGAYIVSAAIN